VGVSSTELVATPHPNPPPQGGREKAAAGEREDCTRSNLITLKNKRGVRSLCRPFGLGFKKTYFRLAIAVRSTESFAIPVAPHQLEPTPLGLIELKLVVPEPSKVLVKALQLAFDRSVSE
jgi:hypothetical protein